MPLITIGNQVINFPNTGRDAVWSDAVVDFAQAVATQLSGAVGPFDIPPLVQNLTLNTNTNLAIVSASFPNTQVRSFDFSYAIYRVSTGGGAMSLDETGTVKAVYNTATAAWRLEHNFTGTRKADGTAYHSFAMSGDQLVLNTDAITGVYDGTNSRISYSATALTVSNI